MNLGLSAVHDRGVVHNMLILPREIRAYVRWAVADQKKRYINQDGSTRYEISTKKELFSETSLHSAAMATVTLDHTPLGENPNPDNYKDVVVGSTGDTTIEEIVNGKSVLGTVISIKDAGAIRSIMARRDAGKPIATSPGYWRLPIKDGTSENTYIQTKRDHFELALVDKARGGDLIRVMDSVQNHWQFDPSQADDDWLAMISLDSTDSESIGKIQRLMQSGVLQPPPVRLPITTNEDKMTLIPIKIGEKTINVAQDSVKDAMDFVSEYTRLVGEIEASKEIAKDFAKAQGEIYQLNYQLASLDAVAKDSAATSKTTAAAVQKYVETGEILDSLEAAGHSLDLAKKAYANYDAESARKEIVAKLVPTAAASNDPAIIDSVLAGYMLHSPAKDAMFSYGNSRNTTMRLPDELIGGNMGAKATYQELVNGSVNGGLQPGTYFLASDASWNKIGVM